MTSPLQTNSTECVKEFRISLNQLKNSSSTPNPSHKAFKTKEEELLNKHKLSKEKIDKKRIKKQTSELKILKFIPKINQKSNELIYAKHEKEIEKFIEKAKQMKKTSKSPEKPPEKPVDPINPPQLSSVIGMFNSRSYLKKDKIVEKINPNKLNITEKVTFYRNKKNSERSQAELKKSEELLKECTFKPDLSKTLSRARSLETMSEVFLNSDKRKSPLLILQPAPNPHSCNSPSKTLSRFSIDNQVYTFKEGVNLQKILEKKKPLLSYNPKTG